MLYGLLRVILKLCLVLIVVTPVCSAVILSPRPSFANNAVMDNHSESLNIGEGRSIKDGFVLPRLSSGRKGGRLR